MKILLFLQILFFLNTPNVLSVSDKQERIIDGVPTSIRRFPFQVLITNGSYICGGSILTQEWILTAGHCVDPNNIFSDVSNYVFILAGSTNLSEVSEVGQIVKVVDAVVHPFYNYNNNELLENDIALLKLEIPLIFNSHVQPIALPTRNSTPTGTAFLSGWGTLDPYNFPGSNPNDLRYVKEKLIDAEVCKTVYSMLNLPISMSSQICTFTGRGSGCSGDSGSPLSQNGKVIGIVSCSLEPCSIYPLVYTKVSYFVDFIEGIIYGNNMLKKN